MSLATDNLTLKDISVARTFSAEGAPTVNRSLHLAVGEQCSESANPQKRKLPSSVQADKRSHLCATLR